jgi:hypothetical protein
MIVSGPIQSIEITAPGIGDRAPLVTKVAAAWVKTGFKDPSLRFRRILIMNR